MQRLLLASVVLAAPVLASPPLPIPVALDAKSFAVGAPDLSPDGEWVAYALLDPRRVTVHGGDSDSHFLSTGASAFAEGGDVWVTRTATGEAVNVTQQAGNNWAPRWSPDGRWLAFYSDRTGRATLWLWDRVSGTERAVSNATIRASVFDEVQWLPDGGSLVVKLRLDLAQESAHAPPSRNDGAGPTVTVFRSMTRKDSEGGNEASLTAPWSTDYTRATLGLVDVGSGSIRKLTPEEEPIHAYALSPDGHSVAYTRFARFAASASQQQLYDVVVISLTRGTSEVIARDVALGRWAPLSWSPDSRRLVFTASWAPLDPRESKKSTPPMLYVFSSDDSGLRTIVLAEHRGVSAQAPYWGKTNELVYLMTGDTVLRASLADGRIVPVATLAGQRLSRAVTPLGSRSLSLIDRDRSLIAVARDPLTKEEGLYSIDLTTGRTRTLARGFVRYGLDFDVSADGGRVLFRRESASQPQDLWTTDTSFKRPKRVTDLNPDFRSYAMGESRLVEWRTLDGLRVQGALLLPAGYQKGRRCPLIVFVYGGGALSKSISEFGLGGAAIDNKQLLASRGYAVLLPDAPLSGNAPLHEIAATVLPGVNRIIELGIADPDRLGVMGHSYGGYTVLSLLTQTRRFKAAVSRAGTGNILGSYGMLGTDGSAYGAAWAEEAQAGMGGHPWEYRERYIENSPIFYLDRVSTPLLIVHGEADTAAPSFLADEIFVGLRRLGKEVEYARYAGEEHTEASWTYANKLDYLTRVIGWFDSHL